MQVITPTPITDAMLVSSSAPETDYAAYAAGTTYALAARVIRTSTHRIYESIAASNVGNTPETSPTKWLDIGPTNRWAMFDGAVGTATALAGPLAVVVRPGAVNALALLELTGASVTVGMTSATEGGVVYSKTITLDGSEISDYYDYFFSPFLLQTSALFLDFPPYADGEVTVTLSGGGTVSMGVMVAGMASELGGTQMGATAGITDYSRKVTDDFGVTTVVKRAYSKRASFNLWLDRSQTNRVHRKLSDLRSTPCVWVGSEVAELSEPFIIFGFYGSFQLEVPYAIASLYSLEIEGLT